MVTGPLDLLVVGGGITGAGIARDAAMRGIRTAVIEKGDFGSGTSSESSKLVHGGLRYLEMGDLGLVFEACRERRTLLRIAPHLVRPQPFLFPVHQGSRVGYWKLAAGLTLYDLLALFRNVGRHRMLRRRATLRLEPHLKGAGLKGAGYYYDARCDDARLTLATVRSAHQHGALAANYVELDDFERPDGQVCGARVTDRMSADTYTIRASVVVNATGPWSDDLRARTGGAPALNRSKGVHVVVPRHRLGIGEHAITMLSPIDGRVMFAIPWRDLAYVGTTDTEDDVEPDGIRATADDVVYLLRSANAMFPAARLGPDDVVSTWAGVRPLARSRRPVAPGSPSAISREHRIIEDDNGLISVVGGKLTTYRAMGAEVVNHVARRLHAVDGRRLPRSARTAREPLPGGEVTDLEILATELVRSGFSREVAEHLVGAYGTEAAAVARIAESDPGWAAPIVGGHPAIRAELVHAIRREMAMTLGDLMMRRTHLFFEVLGHAVPEAPGIVDFAAEELGWDASRKASELATYLEQIQHGMAFRDRLTES